jgi:predicted DNA-binding protein YlxM (UPF0122 family)
MKRQTMTEKQQEVLRLRYQHHNSIDQIAQWLGISRRAVLYRLRNAQKLSASEEMVRPSVPKNARKSQKHPRYATSQITAKTAAFPLDTL